MPHALTIILLPCAVYYVQCTLCYYFFRSNETISHLFPEEEKNESHLFGLQWFSATKWWNSMIIKLLTFWCNFKRNAYMGVWEQQFSNICQTVVCQQSFCWQSFFWQDTVYHWQTTEKCEMFRKLTTTLYSIQFQQIKITNTLHAT